LIGWANAEGSSKSKAEVKRQGYKEGNSQDVEEATFLLKLTSPPLRREL